MKTFKIESIDFPTRPAVLFSEDKPPGWLEHKAYRWFYDDYVLKLEVGASTDTDFTKITRTS